MCVKLSGFLSRLNSATTSRSNRPAEGMRGPVRYSATDDRSEPGICHDASRGTVVDFGNAWSSAGVMSRGTLLLVDMVRIPRREADGVRLRDDASMLKRWWEKV